MSKSSLTLMKHLFRKSSQISDYASRHGQTVVEVGDYLYCYQRLRLTEVFELPEAKEISAVYNATDCPIWRKPISAKNPISRRT
jgi:hypothetical protein